MKQKMKNKRGITLIALIITIIVMLILVGVTVTVALNGGLFTTAKTATTKTELERDKELLIEAAMGAIGQDGKVVYANIQLPNGFTGENGTYTKGDKTFIVDEYGTVSEKENTPWYEATDTELSQIKQNGDKIAETKPTCIIYSLYGTDESLAGILIEYNDVAQYLYLFYQDEQIEDDLGIEYNTFKWYYVDITTDDSEIVEYDGSPSISKSDFNDIYSETYLDRFLENAK